MWVALERLTDPLHVKLQSEEEDDKEDKLAFLQRLLGIKNVAHIVRIVVLARQLVKLNKEQPFAAPLSK